MEPALPSSPAPVVWLKPVSDSGGPRPSQVASQMQVYIIAHNVSLGEGNFFSLVRD